MEEEKNSNAKAPESGVESESITSGASSKEDAAMLLGYSEIPIEDQIVGHLKVCSICKRAIAREPYPIGRKAPYCEVYWHLLWMRATAEGKINNVVAYTEHGDEAPKGRPLA